MNLRSAILKTLSYSDVFDYPLTPAEIHRFLVSAAELQEVIDCLEEIKEIDQVEGYYFLNGRAAIVPIRKHREFVSQQAYRRAQRYGRILGRLPFVRMVTLTGSLAMRNCDHTGDYDYMLVTARGRVWTARLFSLVLNKFANLFGETLCPNLIVSESSLEWKQQNLYSAREIAQMQLVSGNRVLVKLRVVNRWIQQYLPNYNSNEPIQLNEKPSMVQRILESVLGGRLGNILEAWEMNRKIRKFSKQTGFGVETNFNADICQGNFDHHGLWTLQRYEERLRKLNLSA